MALADEAAATQGQADEMVMEVADSELVAADATLEGETPAGLSAYGDTDADDAGA